MKLTSQISSRTSLMPTAWPAKTVLKLIFSPQTDSPAIGDHDYFVMEGIIEMRKTLIFVG